MTDSIEREELIPLISAGLVLLAALLSGLDYRLIRQGAVLQF